jgi:hypothetical protein
VLTKPGHTALIRIPRCANSRAAVLVKYGHHQQWWRREYAIHATGA